MPERSAASSHDCVCLHAPGYRPKVCECSVYTDEHGDWCGNENCRAPLNRGAHLTTLTRLSEELPGAAITREQELEAALEELLDVAERIRGGDPNLNPERWYAASEYARIVLKKGKPDA